MQNSNGILCRTCLKQSESVHPVTHTCIGHEEIDFVVMLMSCTSISIDPSDSLPHYICEDCISRLIMAYTFKEQCEKSDLFLRTRECLKSIKTTDQKLLSITIDEECSNDLSQTENHIESNDIKDESIDNNDNLDIETTQVNIKQENSENRLQTKQQKTENGLRTRKLFVVCKKKENMSEGTIKKQNSYNNDVQMRKYKRRSKVFKCLECDKQFTSKYGLLYHTQLHSGIRKLVCPIENCTKTFFWKPALNRHMQIHSTEKKFLCNLCGKAYSAADSLQHHIKTHSGERPYLCIYCGKTYTQSVHLKYHMRSHSGERPHVCLKCNRSYTRPSHLKKHQNKYCGIGKIPPRRIRRNI